MDLVPSPLLVVARALPVPGLGLLLLSTETTPRLMPVPLHTTLAIELHLPDGRRLAATATVEEVAADAAPQRALLLTEAEWLGSVPAGTEVWAQPEAADPYADLL